MNKVNFSSVFYNAEECKIHFTENQESDLTAVLSFTRVIDEIAHTSVEGFVLRKEYNESLNLYLYSVYNRALSLVSDPTTVFTIFKTACRLYKDGARSDISPDQLNLIISNLMSSARTATIESEIDHISSRG
ncbi:hypothetical protein LIS04_210 [Listeria phage LIS04]|nr:hypothetical protein LIS04_210 [Listeria phage LIS04]